MELTTKKEKSLQKELTKLQTENNKLQTENKSLQRENKKLLKELTKLQMENNTLKNHNKEYQQINKQLHQDLIEKDFDDQTTEIEKLKDEISELKIIKETWDQHVKTVEHNKSIIKKFSGTDLFSTTEQEWANSSSKENIDDYIAECDKAFYNQYDELNNQFKTSYQDKKFRVQGATLFNEYLVPKHNPKTGEDLTFNDQKIIKDWYQENISDYNSTIEQHKAELQALKDGQSFREEAQLSTIAYKFLDAYLNSFDSIDTLS